MYYVTKRMEISAAHSLRLSYDSKCSEVHGHNWIITLHCKSKWLNADGMVGDFTAIKQKIHQRLDHNTINSIIPQPTAENIAYWCVQEVPLAFKCEVQESEGNVAIYEEDGR